MRGRTFLNKFADHRRGAEPHAQADEDADHARRPGHQGRLPRQHRADRHALPDRRQLGPHLRRRPLQGLGALRATSRSRAASARAWRTTPPKCCRSTLLRNKSGRRCFATASEPFCYIRRAHPLRRNSMTLLVRALCLACRARCCLRRPAAEVRAAGRPGRQGRDLGADARRGGRPHAHHGAGRRRATSTWTSARATARSRSPRRRSSAPRHRHRVQPRHGEARQRATRRRRASPASARARRRSARPTSSPPTSARPPSSRSICCRRST